MAERAVEGKRLLELLPHGRGATAAVERDLSREQLEEDHPERIDVATRVEWPAHDLLRAHVGGGADDGVAARDRGLRRLLLLGRGYRLCDPEIHQADPFLGVDHDVARLEVAVEDARLVDGPQAGGRLESHAIGQVYRERRLLPEHLAEVLPSDQLHRAIQDALILAVFVDGADVLVPDLAGQRDLVVEAPYCARVRLEAQHLEGHGDAEGPVAGAEYRAHSALAEPSLDLVAVGDHPAGGDGQRLAAGLAAPRGRVGDALAGRARHRRHRRHHTPRPGARQEPALTASVARPNVAPSRRAQPESQHERTRRRARVVPPFRERRRAGADGERRPAEGAAPRAARGPDPPRHGRGGPEPWPRNEHHRLSRRGQRDLERRDRGGSRSQLRGAPARGSGHEFGPDVGP